MNDDSNSGRQRYTGFQVEVLKQFAGQEQLLKQIVERQDRANGTLGKHEATLQDHRLALQPLVELVPKVDRHERALNEARGSWRAVVIIAGVVSVVVGGLSGFITPLLRP